MAPKAKPRARAKAKAMAVIRRPAGRHRGEAPGAGAPVPRRGVLRRPAHHAEGRSPWEEGHVVDLHQVPLGQLVPGSSLVVTEGDYFGAVAKVAGQIHRVEALPEGTFLSLRLTGTDCENVLKAHTGNREQPFRLHICPPGCGRQETGDFFLHALKGRRAKGEAEEGWVTSLQTAEGALEEDQLAGLRRRGEALEVPAVPGATPKRSKSPEATEEKKEKKKKKQKKEKDKETEVVSGRQASKAGQKELKELFAGTGLDPKEKVRRRVVKRAQKYIAKKRSRRSSSSGSEDGSRSSSTSSTTGANNTEGVFTEETKARALGERFPGTLALETLGSMRKSLLTTAGEDGESQTTRPVALLYFRNVLSRKTTGPQARELLTLSTAIDALLKGRPAHAVDILCQRVKSQEAVADGTHWAIAQKVELAEAEATALIARGELREARRESYLDSRTQWQSQANSQGKGQPKGKNKGKQGKEDAPREDRKDEGRKGKGKTSEKK
eukprot:s21_g4.t1